MRKVHIAFKNNCHQFSEALLFTEYFSNETAPCASKHDLGGSLQWREFYSGGFNKVFRESCSMFSLVF